jgi:hypothetical protein
VKKTNFFKILFPGQTGTVVNDRIRRNTTIYMVPYYDRLSSSRIRRNTEEKPIVYCLSTRRPYTVSVLLRFSPHMIVLLRIRARRYTIVIRDHVIRQNTVVYGGIRTVYGRLRAYTDSVIVDLGMTRCSYICQIFFA